MYARLVGVVVPLILRLCLAAIFIFHGYQKVATPGNDAGAAWMKGEDAPPKAVQLAVAYGEFAGGIAMAIGFLTRLAALGIIAIMAGAIYTVTGGNGFDNLSHGYEYNMAIIAMALSLFFLGGGLVAVDRLLRFRRRKP
jgi:putative oxidoreductase